MPEVRLMTWNPGHFHAALVQKEGKLIGIVTRYDVLQQLIGTR